MQVSPFPGAATGIHAISNMLLTTDFLITYRRLGWGTARRRRCWTRVETKSRYEVIFPLGCRKIYIEATTIETANRVQRSRWFQRI